MLPWIDANGSIRTWSVARDSIGPTMPFQFVWVCSVDAMRSGDVDLVRLSTRIV